MIKGLGTGARFNALDYQNQTSVGNSDYWRRSWETGGTPKLELPIVYSYPNSYLRHSGCSVSAYLRLQYVSFELSLIAKMVHKGAYLDPNYELEVYPHARIRIRIECVVTATLPDGGCVLPRTWMGPGHELPVTIDNADSSEAYPRISPDFEQLVCVDAEGVQSHPPIIVEWWGMLGSFSQPPTHNIWPVGAIRSGQASAMCPILRDTALKDLFIPAWPYANQSRAQDPNQVYTGGVTLAFPT
jgi:hypothetical protein